MTTRNVKEDCSYVVYFPSEHGFLSGTTRGTARVVNSANKARVFARKCDAVNSTSKLALSAVGKPFCVYDVMPVDVSLIPRGL